MSRLINQLLQPERVSARQDQDGRIKQEGRSTHTYFHVVVCPGLAPLVLYWMMEDDVSVATKTSNKPAWGGPHTRIWPSTPLALVVPQRACCTELPDSLRQRPTHERLQHDAGGAYRSSSSAPGGARRRDDDHRGRLSGVPSTETPEEWHICWVAAIMAPSTAASTAASSANSPNYTHASNKQQPGSGGGEGFAARALAVRGRR